MSSDIIWALTKDSNKYRVRNLTGDRAIFSKDPHNLINKNVQKYSGLAATKPFGIKAKAKGAGVEVTTKKTKKSTGPKTSYNTVAIKGGSRRASKAVEHILARYNPTLTKAAKARVSQILRSQTKKATAPAKETAKKE